VKADLRLAAGHDSADALAALDSAALQQDAIGDAQPSEHSVDR